MPEDFTIATAGNSQIEQALQVLSDGYGRPFRREWFEWKHREGPWGPSRVVMARDDVGPLGIVFGLPWAYRCGDERVLGIRLVDGATTPRATRRGVFGGIVRELLDPTDGTVAPPMVIATATRAAQGAHVKNGAVALDPIDFVLRPTRYSGAALDTTSVLERYVRPGARDATSTAWEPDSLRWRCDERSGNRYLQARLRHSDHYHGLIYSIRSRRGVRMLSITALWGPTAEQALVLRAAARTHRVLAVSGPHGAGTATDHRATGLRRGSSLLCVWDRRPGSDGSSSHVKRWALSGLDLEGVI